MQVSTHKRLKYITRILFGLTCVVGYVSSLNMSKLFSCAAEDDKEPEGKLKYTE